MKFLANLIRTEVFIFFLYRNGESGKSVEELSSASSNEPEASPKKKVDSDRNKVNAEQP